MNKWGYEHTINTAEQKNSNFTYQQPDGLCGETASTPARRSTPAEEAAVKEAYHRGESQKHAAAAAFLSQYPQFSDFIDLVRKGVIQF